MGGVNPIQIEFQPRSVEKSAPAHAEQMSI